MTAGHYVIVCNLAATTAQACAPRFTVTVPPSTTSCT